MAERRQATRREPIEIGVADGRVFTAHPLPWPEASDLGNEIMRQNVEAANKLFSMYVDDAGVPQLEMQAQMKISDWQTVLRQAYPNEPEEKWQKPYVLSGEECADLMLAALEVNHLEHLRHLVDPNFPTPMTPGGTSFLAETEGNGTKTEFTPNSESQDSVETTPSS